MRPVLLSMLLLLGCDFDFVETEPYGPCAGSTQYGLVCDLGSYCVHKGGANVCAPACDASGQPPEDVDVQLVPAGEELTCEDGVAVVLCHADDSCPWGRVCVEGLCLWPEEP